jgi:hypothetical protein
MLSTIFVLGTSFMYTFHTHFSIGYTMLEETALSSVDLLLVLFGLILLFIIVYGVISLRAVKHMKSR